MAPILPLLNAKEKKKLMEKEKISMDDLKAIKKIYEKSKDIEAQKEGVEAKTSVAYSQFETDVQINKKPGINRAFARLNNLIPEGTKEL